MVEISTQVDITSFTQNKPMNNHLKFGKCLMGHPINFKVKLFMSSLCNAAPYQYNTMCVSSMVEYWTMEKDLLKQKLYLFQRSTVLPYIISGP
jgi:hypothetical protein